MSISPDGRQILVHVDALPWVPGAFAELEFALLENFNPKAAPVTPKPAAKAVKK